MPWEYKQATGAISLNGKNIAFGYSGKSGGKNNPSLEGVPNMGPIPRGRYRIGPGFNHQSKGPTTMALTPIGHSALGRSGFLIHGDSRKHPGNASEGCIVVPPEIRTLINQSSDRIIEVVN